METSVTFRVQRVNSETFCVVHLSCAFAKQFMHISSTFHFPYGRLNKKSAWIPTQLCLAEP